ncbi:elongation factor G [Candidatus Sumerlaeota bacterium]|nr:elongation factor G [Candidatus Sumerlaeota bacterium]
MKTFSTENIRNVGLAGHPGSGKTSLTEAILFVTGQIDRLGKVDDGNTASDSDPEETKRHISILAGVAPAIHGDRKINVLDTPGTADFIGEIRGALRVADALIVTIDGTGGVAAGTELAVETAEEFGLPICFAVNKMDKEHADFAKAVQTIRDELGLNAVPVALPIGQEADLRGVVDLVEQRALISDDRGRAKPADVPADLADEVASAAEALQEAAAEGKDELIEKYFEEGKLTVDETREGLHAAILQRRVCPVLCCSATSLVGVGHILDFIADTLPAPNERPALRGKSDDEEVEIACDPAGPVIAYVFKTVSDAFTGKITHFRVVSGKVDDDATLQNIGRNTSERLGHMFALIGKKHEPISEVHAGDIAACAKLNVTLTGDTLAESKSAPLIEPTPLAQPTTQLAIVAKSKGDEEKIGVHIHKLTDADPTLRVLRQGHLSQTVLAGMGDTHLDVALSRLKDAAKIELELKTPRVDYHETITKTAQDQYRHKKQTGGAGQFGEVHLRLEPVPEGGGFEFAWEVVGGNIPTKFQGACEKGIRQGMESGILAGCQAVDIRAAVFDGKHHPVDSKDIAFQIAALQAFKKVAAMANPVLLEPICLMEITAPESAMGDIMGDLNSKRGRILGSEPQGRRVLIKAQVPQAEVFTYSRDLRSMTQGRGTFTVSVSHYERVPPEIQAKVVEAYQREREERG